LKGLRKDTYPTCHILNGEINWTNNFVNLTVYTFFEEKFGKPDTAYSDIMRQLKGKEKENAKQRKERKKEFMENKEKVWTVALPTLGVIFLFVILYVYLNSRPKIAVD